MFDLRLNGGLLRRLSQFLIATLISATFVLFQPLVPPVQASGVLADGSNSVVDFAADAYANSFYVSSGTYLQADSTLTFEAWVKPKSSMTDPVDHVLVAKHYDYAIAVNSGEWVYWAGNGSGGWGTRFFSGVSASTGAWVHISLVLDGNYAHFFVNGQEVHSTNTRNVTNDSSSIFSLGDWNTGAGSFDADIDEVRVWNVNRTAQLASDMHTKVSSNATGLLAYWDFNEGSGTTINDRVGSYNLTVRSEPDFLDVKQVSSVAGGDTVTTFPRTYLPGVGSWKVPANSSNVRALAVAGGGGGGGTHGGGGGGGEVAVFESIDLTSDSIIQVGQGGLGFSRSGILDCTANKDAFAGQNTVIGSFTLRGGGAGINGCGDRVAGDENGGSGGGSPYLGNPAGSSTTNTSNANVTFFGNDGGVGASWGAAIGEVGGGGGGATSAGEAAVQNTRAGNGGAGLGSSITGTLACYGSGGGGGARQVPSGLTTASTGGSCSGTGPSGGSGGIGATHGADGLAGTGSGGGGGGVYESGATRLAAAAGDGGSGAVVVRYSPSTDLAWSKSSSSGNYAFTNSQVVPASGAWTFETWVLPNEVALNSSDLYGIFTQQADSDVESTRAGLWIHEKGIGYNYGGVAHTRSAPVLFESRWYHIALAVTANSQKVYLDGQLFYSSTEAEQAIGGNFVLGGLRQTNFYEWPGQLDQVKVWTGELTHEQVQTSMHTYSSSGITGKTLRAHYDFNDPIDGIVLDRSGNGQHLGFNTDVAGDYASSDFTSSAILETGSATPTDKYFKFNRSYLTATGGWIAPDGISQVDYLIVAGGGGGGGRLGGGGGAGGMLTGSDAFIAPGTPLAIQVGQGGKGGNIVRSQASEDGANGGTSSALGLTALGGGGGGGTDTRPGKSGGSGGGAGRYSTAAGGQGTAGQGNDGGGTVSNVDRSGGGGGAGEAGASGGLSGNGGAGLPSAITGTSLYYAGGGGGAIFNSTSAGVGGIGGGGGAGSGVNVAGSGTVGESGETGTGGGGGGGGFGSEPGMPGGNGGSGIVILSYSLAPDAPTSLTATQSTSHATVNLSWAAPSYAGNSAITDYEIEYKPAGGSWTSYSDGVSTATSATLVLAQQCVAHDFRVTAKNSAYTSSPSATASAVPVWGTFGSLGGVQISSDDSECVVKFTSTASSTMWTPPIGIEKVRALVVGGGGGGGAWVGAGGGAGGFTESDSLSLTGDALSIQVGSGGAGGKLVSGVATDGSNGQASTISSQGQPLFAAQGGGRGAGWANGQSPGTGGSGGGGNGYGSSNANWAGASGIVGQGNAGGNGQPSTQWASGGGGGAGGVGGVGEGFYAGDGGVGKQSSITGTAVYYAGGGGGGYHGNNAGNPVYYSIANGDASNSAGTGGLGGGGDGGQPTGYSTVETVYGVNGLSGTGGGGGGAGKAGNLTSIGGNGGSGIVILRQLAVASPEFVSQPQSVSAEPGQTKTLSVSATGNGTLSYQWQFSTNGTSWTSVGTNSSSLTTAALTLADDGIQYRVVVTNTLNGQSSSVTSSIATISVTGVTITAGACSAMVGNDSGVTISETANGACLVEYTSPGNNSFFVPNLVSSIQAFIVGGGGGGGGAKLGEGGGGGGGGAASRVVTLAVTTSQVIPVTVGSGGAGGAANSNGQNGSATSVSTSYSVPGGAGGKAPTSWPGGAGEGGIGAYATWASSGGSGGAGVTDPGDRSYYQPKFGNAGSSRTFAGEFWCVGGGGGGGNREVSNDVYFQWEPRSQYCSDGVAKSGGSGGWHNGTTNILPTSGDANRGGGGGGGSYNSATNTVRAGASGADGVVAIYYVPSTGVISLSSVAAVSYSGTTHAIALTKDNTSTDVTWTTSNTAVCTVSGDETSATVTEVAGGLCEVSVVVAASSPYARGTSATSFQIDKITRTAPTWTNNSLSVPYGGTIDLRPRLSSPGSNAYTFSTSGTAGSCSVTGYTLNVGNVGDTCNVRPTLVGDAIYLDVDGTQLLSVTVTKISQSALVITSGTTMNVNQTLTVSAAGGSGDGALSYHVESAGLTGCTINSSTGVLAATAAGDCEVYAKRATSTNYDQVTSSHVVVTLNKVAQNLSWVSQPQAQYLPGNVYSLEATASSQLTVAYSISAGLCQIENGNDVRFTGSGDCVILAGQSGSDSYLEAVTISQTVSVGKINQTMTFSALADNSWGSLAFSLSATASSGLTIAYSKSAQTTNDACDVSGAGIVTIKNVGTCAITATQAGNAAYTSVATTRLFEVTANQAGAPFIGSVSFGDRQLNAFFFTPSYLGGGTISAYELRAYELDGTLASTNTGCVAGSGATQSCSVIGLDNGKKYVLKVAAITQAGLGEISASSSEIIPAANPEAVGNLIAIEGNGTLSLQWSAPTSLGGGSFDQYRIFWRAPGEQYQSNGSPGGTVGSQASTSFVITGLENGVAYDVKITTVTSVNTLELQSNTAEVRQTPFTVPDAPAAVVALDNDETVVVAWQPPTFDGGNPIDQYVVKKGNTTVCTITSASSNSCEIPKPNPGTTEIIEVRAGNDAGLSVAASTSITIAALQVTSNPIIGGGGISLPGVTQAANMPNVLDVSGSAVVKTNDVLRLIGTNFNLVEKVFIGGVEASFFINSSELITIRIPMNTPAGNPVVTLQGAFGSKVFSGLLNVLLSEVSLDSKVTIGTFLGFAAVYTKNHEGKRLSMRIGSKWRVIDPLGSDYTYNFTKVGKGKTVTVMVYLDRKLVKVQQVKIN